MNYNDKKILALAIQYLDEAVEGKLSAELQRLEESRAFLSQEPILVEGPRGPRGFRGEEGEQGPKGDPADPNDVARLLRVDESFVRSVIGPKGDKGEDADPHYVVELLKNDNEFKEELRGPKGEMGPEGPRGLDADNNSIVRRLKSSKVFQESVRGFPGNEGPMGPEGPKGKDGIGVQSLSLNESGELIYTKTDGSTDIAGKLNLPDEQSIRDELAKLKKDLQLTKSEVTQKLTQQIFAAGGNSGGGEVRIEFMDDFDRSTKLNAIENNLSGLVQWNNDTQKFDVSLVSLQEIINRITNIEEYLDINIPPEPSAVGVIPLVSSVNPYLVDDGTQASIPVGSPDDIARLYSIRVTDPNSNDMVIDTAIFTPIESIDLESNFSLFGYDLYLAYIQSPAETGPFPIQLNGNDYIDSTGMFMEILFEDLGVDNVEAWRMTLKDEVVEPEFRILGDRIQILTNRPVFGTKIDLMVNYEPEQGNQSVIIPLTGARHDITLQDYGITYVLNYATFDTTTGELVSFVEYLNSDTLSFENGSALDGHHVKIWFT